VGGSDPILHQTISLPDGRTLGFAEYGDPSGRPVLLFPGTPSGRLFHHPDESITLSLGARVFTIDRPGDGFPFAYATFLSGLLGLLAMPSSDPPRAGLIVLLMLPLVAGALDWIENGLLILLLESTDGQRQLLVTIASVVASAKWIPLLVSLVVVNCLFLKKTRPDCASVGGEV